MSAEVEPWVPGDPLMPDNGCGHVPPVTWSTQERADVIAEGDAPPWWRPEPEGANRGYTRTCTPCDVRWAGDEPCWMCGGLDEFGGVA